MDALNRTIDGEDLVISRKEIEDLGLKPDDKVVIWPEARLIPLLTPDVEHYSRITGLQLVTPADL